MGVWVAHTFSNACHGFILVTIGFLEGKKHVDLGPIREHLTDN
jgi:hypothetical protein